MKKTNIRVGIFYLTLLDDKGQHWRNIFFWATLKQQAHAAKTCSISIHKSFHVIRLHHVRWAGLGVMSAADMCHPIKTAAGRLCQQQNSKRNCFFQGLWLEINNSIKWLAQVSEWSIYTLCPCRGRCRSSCKHRDPNSSGWFFFRLGFFTALRIQRSRRLTSNPISPFSLRLKLLHFPPSPTSSFSRSILSRFSSGRHALMHF